MVRHDDMPRSRRACAAVILSAVTLLGAASAPTARAGSGPRQAAAEVEPVRSGDIAVVDADTRRKELSHGGSATQFSVEAPDGASCPGDSEHDSWRVQTFIVPAAYDPGTIPYGAEWPRYSEHLYSLYDTITEPVIDRLTVPNDRPGLPGRIDALPPMSFAVFPVGELPEGNYRIGIACALNYDTANYWDAEIVITSAPDDEPAKFVWRLATAPAVAPAADDASIAPWLILAAVVLAVVALVVARRRRAARIVPPRSKESQ